MADSLRAHFALTQQRLAEWLGVHRVVVAQAEAGLRDLPLGRHLRQGVQHLRFTLATVGQMLRGSGIIEPAPAPLPAPPVNTKALRRRIAACRMQAARLASERPAMQARATAYVNRLAALPALRGYTDPVPDPVQEARWLSLFELEASVGLHDECGPGPQALATARQAGLEREAEVLENLLAGLE
ncbi:hypothetical protein [Hymenobacter negativus]|uniref:XRE family transcriptional regulator n=1 Tax=Hymenobacter negativus TaxID=2795026 RepID=A0ABS3QB82_9BACT|nr:hypothetical protein [Hymenobacter negativus]MBO2008446.1 hypothetical protein [Hymenobacter negativus]